MEYTSKIAQIKQQQLQDAAEGKPVAAETAPVSVRRLAAIKAEEIANGNQYAAQSDQPDSTQVATPAELQTLEHYQAAMDADLASLAQLKEVAEKAKAKKTMIETYWGFVKAYMDNGDNYPNSIAVRLVIWLFDVLDVERGLQLALHLIKQGGHVTPPKFDRDLPTFVCDALYDIAANWLKADQSASPYLDTLVATIDNDKWELSPPVLSKMYVLLAKHKNRDGDYLTCVALCEKAESVNPEGAGVKGLKAGALAKLKTASQKAAE